MASSLTLKKLLASRPLYSFRPPTRSISTNPFRDNDPQEDIDDTRSNLCFRIVIPLSPTASLISQLGLFLYGGGPALVRQWSKTTLKNPTKPINLIILHEEEEEEEEEEEVKVNVGIKHNPGLRSASHSVWLNETAKPMDLLNDNGNVGQGVLVSFSHEIGCQPMAVWGQYSDDDGLHLYISMPRVGAEEAKVSVEENTVDIEAEPPVDIVDLNERYTLRIYLPEKIFDTLGVEAKIRYGMLKIRVPKVRQT